MKIYKYCILYAATLSLGFLGSLDTKAETWLFDFGPATQLTPNYNNITNPGIESHTGLINADGITTGASLTMTVPFNTGGTNSNGTTTPSIETGFPATATRDSFFGNTVIFQGNLAPNAQLIISGLDTTQHYDFTLFASRLGVTDNRQTEYKITGTNSEITYLNATANASEIALVTDIQPKNDGTIVIDLAPGPDNTNSNKFFYLGAMKIVSRSIAQENCGDGDASLNDKLTKYPYVDGSSPYTMGHWLYRPAGYSFSPCKKYPLLVWLHGLGEVCSKGSLDALNKSSLNSPGFQIMQGSAYANQRPFLNGLILQPQTCTSWNAANIDTMIDYIKTQVRVDEDRIYITGLSLGGGGTWSYAAARSTKVAAIVPVAGTESALGTINNASHVPTWAFHNYNDTNVGPGLNPPTELFRCKSYTHRECTIEHIDRMIPFATTNVMFGYSPNHGATQASETRTALLEEEENQEHNSLPQKWNWTNGYQAITSASKTRLTLYAASGHGGWYNTYDSQDMWQWLYNQHREPAPTLKINIPLIAPANAGLNSGATLVLSAKIGLGGVAIAEIVADLKALGGSNIAPLTYDSASKTYRLSYTLPTSGLAIGAKAVAIIAVDTAGNRTVKYVTFTIDP